MRCPSALDIRREHNPNLVLCHVILNGGEAGVRDRTTVGGFDAADGKCPKAYAICATAITAPGGWPRIVISLAGRAPIGRPVLAIFARSGIPDACSEWFCCVAFCSAATGVSLERTNGGG